jgi:hypothetical protein
MGYRARARAQGNAIQCYARVGPSAGVGIRLVDPSLPKVGAVCGKAARTVLYGGAQQRASLPQSPLAAAVHMSAYGGTWPRWPIPPAMSDAGGKADLAVASGDFRK